MTLPDVILAGGEGKRRGIESAVMDFPQPDSPTKHTISEGAIENETSLTAFQFFFDTESDTSKDSILRIG